MIKKPTIEEIVAAEGVEVEEVASSKHAASHNTATGAVQINAQNVTLGNVSLNAGNALGAEAFPKVKSVKEMDKEEQGAFHDGQWDGLDRRTMAEDAKEYTRALRQRKRRKRDRTVKLMHYITLIILLLTLFGSFVVSLLLNGYAL